MPPSTNTVVSSSVIESSRERTNVGSVYSWSSSAMESARERVNMPLSATT